MTGVAFPDFWAEATEARIGLGRAGSGLPTAPLLDFQLAHARARDAVHSQLDCAAIERQLGAPPIIVDSRAEDRATYLQRPDLGRALAPECLAKLPDGPFDAAFVLADGLSARAVEEHAVAVFKQTVTRLAGWNIPPPVVARQARVALGDEIGAAMGAQIVIMLIGERPGLTAANSLGAYLTWAPQPGRRDSQRNCISNIRPPRGMSCEAAADLLSWLIAEARRRQETGVNLKDERVSPERLTAARTITKG